jgi:hypothetical protein
VCAHVGNQRSHGVVITRFLSFYMEPSSSTSRSPSIDVSLPFGRLGSNLSSAMMLTCLLMMQRLHWMISSVGHFVDAAS